MYACPHSPRPFRICRHLLAAPPVEGASPPDDGAYHLAFEGSDYRPLCAACAAGTPELAECCDACRRDYLRTDTFGSFQSFVGSPAPADRTAGLTLVTESLDLRGVLRDEILAMAPVGSGARPRWVLWTKSRRLVTVALPSGEVLAATDPLPAAALPEAEPNPERPYGRKPRVTLQVSADGRFAALLLETRSEGVIVETETGRARLPLNRGDYHVDVCGWPFAFVERGGRTLAVHAVDWNTFGATDVESGNAVRRPSEEDGSGAFLCTTTVSPGGRWIASAGWVWHPCGMLEVFRLDRWLEGERRPGARPLNQTGYHWDGPNVFLDEDRLLVWGLGNDDETMVDAGIVHDLATGEIAGFWPGLPYGALFADRARGLVYCAGAGATSVWDAATGERLAIAPGFVASGFHPAGHLAGLDADGRVVVAFPQNP